ncbi:unnamed protein product [Closterium sp. NIES-54]
MESTGWYRVGRLIPGGATRVTWGGAWAARAAARAFERAVARAAVWAVAHGCSYGCVRVWLRAATVGLQGQMGRRFKLRVEFRAAHLLTFMVISRCCSPVVQLALGSCQERLDAGHQPWHFILSTYQAKDDLYIGQLEEHMTHLQMGEQESPTDYCNRARRILAEMRMAGVEYSTVSYITHVVKGLPRGYNLMKRMMMVPVMRESLDEDSITSYVL